MDSMIVQVALSGLDNILKAGELHNAKPNPYAVLIEECFGNKTKQIFLNIGNHSFTHISIGLDKLEFLQAHDMKEIYEKAFYILEKYFNTEVEDCRVAPSLENNQYQFNAEEMSGFEF